MSDDNTVILEAARDFYDNSKTVHNENRTSFENDVRFAKLGEQWPEEIKRQREVDERPCLTINRMPSFGRQVVNDARQNKPQPRAKAADSYGDPETAEIINGLIRNIEHISNADVAYDTAIDNAVYGGFGYIRVNIDYAFDDAFDLDIMVDRVLNPLSVYEDPNATSADGHDWTECLVTDRLTEGEFEAAYPDAVKTDFESEEWSNLGADWKDDDGVVIAEYWKREQVDKEIIRLSDGRIMEAEQLAQDESLQIMLATEADPLQVTGRRTVKAHKVTQYIMTGLEVLETNDWPGSYIPIVPVYGEEVVIGGERRFLSLIHHAKDAQRMMNYWRTVGTETVALSPKAPFVGAVGQFATDDGWSHANTKNLPYLEYDVVDGAPPPQRQPLDMGVAAGAMQEALNATDDMKSIMGIYDASLGARSNEVSGRAIMARQREGDVSTFHFIDNLSRAIRHVGRIIIDLIPHVYTGERVIRVLGEDKKEQTVPLGVPVPVMGKDGKPQINQMGEAIARIYDLSLGKYDLAVESGPSFTTQREELALMLQEMIRANPQSAAILGSEWVRASDFPGAEKIAAKLDKIDPTNKDDIPPELQEQIKDGMATIQKLKAENQKLKTDMTGDQMDAKVEMAKLALEGRKLDLEERKIAIEEARLAAHPAMTGTYAP